MIKLIPIIALVASSASGKTGLPGKFEIVLNLARNAAVQSEINSLAKIVYLDGISGETVDTEKFADYCRKNLITKSGSSRDTSKDLWGSDYKLNKLGGRFEVRSAGPDKTFGTSDDVVIGY